MMADDRDRAARVITLLKETGALLEGHFLLSSGLHSERYFQCARLLQHPAYASEVGRCLADACRDLEPETVASPALGGIIIGHETGRALGTKAVFAERVGGALVFRRGFEIPPGERVIVIEDVVTTGKSSLETVAALRELGAEVVGLGCIVDRSGGANLGIPFRSLLALHTPAFEPADCGFCKTGTVPLTKPGSREFNKP